MPTSIDIILQNQVVRLDAAIIAFVNIEQIAALEIGVEDQPSIIFCREGVCLVFYYG